MRPSRYNVLAPAADDESYVLYNTATQACVTLSHDEREEYLLLAGGGKASGDLFDDLVEFQFFVSDPQAELDYMRYRFTANKFDSSMLELTICPSLDFDRGGNASFGIRRAGAMSDGVRDSLIGFIEDRCDHTPFASLNITWLIGCADVDAEALVGLDGALHEIAKERGSHYHSSVHTACGLLPEELPNEVIDGFMDDVSVAEEVQECDHSLDKQHDEDDFLVAIDSCGKPGNVDGESIVDRHMADHPEYKPKALALLDAFLSAEPSQAEFEDFLVPLRAYCDVSVENSLAIDEQGNVYSCVRDLGVDDRVLFNIGDRPDARPANAGLVAKYGNDNPLDVEECATCRVYPLCCGGCARVRTEDGVLTCIPLRYAIEEYLTAYSATLK